MYESLNCERCYQCFFVEDCSGVSNSYFCKDCRGCDNCFGCVGLRNQSYRWFNKKLSKKDYQNKLDSIQWSTENFRNLRKKFQELCLKFPMKYYRGSQIINSTGDYISNSKNTLMSFNCRLSENLKYSQDAWEARDCMDMTETLDNELDYEMEGAGWGSRCIASAKSWYNHDILYSELNFNCHDIFGCLSLKKKSYCILNKQYTEQEYKKLKAKLIDHMKKTGEWGEFFPINISPFPYNDSLAQSYFPLTKQDVLSRDWQWYDRDSREHQITLNHQDLPPTITRVADDILNQTISCSSQDSETGKRKYLRCATAFKIHPAELAFYKKYDLPIPHKCLFCRLQDRLARRNPRVLLHRKCQCAGEKSSNGAYKNTVEHSHGKDPCPNEFLTTYAPDRKEIVYCEKCYLKEVV